jgi:hypothetical protein
MRRHIPRPSPATVIATIALFVALGGSALALGRHSVGTPQIKRNAVTASKIKRHAVTRLKIAKHAVGAAQIADDAITGQEINESTLGQVPSAASAINSENVDKFVPFGIISVSSGESRTLVSYGPFSLIGRCELNGSSVEALVAFATTEAHTSFGGQGDSGGDVGPETPEEERLIEDPGAASEIGAPPESSGGVGDQFDAQAPSGRSWAGTVESWASGSAQLCRWSGYVLKTS